MSARGFGQNPGCTGFFLSFQQGVINEFDNQPRKKRKKNRKKKLKAALSQKAIHNQNRDKISNHVNYNFNNIFNNNNNENTFIFNSFFTTKSKKEKPDWMKEETQKVKNNYERFNKEIIEYVNYIIPKKNSLANRNYTQQRLINIIKKYQPSWKVVLFGSFSQNTSTVFSDLDFEVLSIDKNSTRRMDINELYYLQRILRNEGFSKNIRLIKARVPILKATCSQTGINVDISVNRDNGADAAKIIRNILKKYNILRPTLIILKILLKSHDFNEAHSGGMSSFLLFHLVYFFFLQFQKRLRLGIGIKDLNNINNADSLSNNSKDNNSDDDEEEEDEDEEDKEVSYDSNSEYKRNSKNKNSKSNESGNSGRGIIITKTIASTDEDISNDDDSNILKNGNSSSSSDESKDKKLTDINHYNNTNEEESDEDEDDEEDEEDKKKEEKNNDDDDENDLHIANFLFNFFDFYAKVFDYKNLGFSLNSHNFGETFFKLERQDMDYSNTISAESIQDKGIDVGRSCYNYPKIRNLFKNTYEKIKNEMAKNTLSILQSLGFPSI